MSAMNGSMMIIAVAAKTIVSALWAISTRP